uniref:Succinate:cytochrome c oxidoreductase subunit 3 n=1 Tax=Riquetophycus sp. HSY-2014a TaxID=1488470 RepID=A0A0E3DB58_9FLOR|nr:succinate:cytochrome c oxidoreductase subunit 3 [Riquetophycus sp. HSY-2014a]
MFYKFYIYNRPISPHLLIYSPQVSSLFSIWHRITGVTLAITISIFLLYLKILTISNFYFVSFIINLILFLKSISWFISYIYLIILFLLLYHIFNGIRHIFWDLGFFLNNQHLIFSTIVFIFILCFILILNIIKIA